MDAKWRVSYNCFAHYDKMAWRLYPVLHESVLFLISG